MSENGATARWPAARLASFQQETPMSFRTLGLPPDLFRGYFSMSDAELQSIGAVRRIADTAGWPCRVSLEHAAIGEEVLLLNYEHQPGDTPYRSRHAIYVRRG